MPRVRIYKFYADYAIIITDKPCRLSLLQLIKQCAYICKHKHYMGVNIVIIKIHILGGAQE